MVSKRRSWSSGGVGWAIPFSPSGPKGNTMVPNQSGRANGDTVVVVTATVAVVVDSGGGTVVVVVVATATGGGEVLAVTAVAPEHPARMRATMATRVRLTITPPAYRGPR